MAIFHPFPLLTLLSSLDRASTRRCGNVKEINRRIRLLETGLPYCLASGGRIVMLRNSNEVPNVDVQVRLGPLYSY